MQIESFLLQNIDTYGHITCVLSYFLKGLLLTQQNGLQVWSVPSRNLPGPDGPNQLYPVPQWSDDSAIWSLHCGHVYHPGPRGHHYGWTARRKHTHQRIILYRNENWIWSIIFSLKHKVHHHNDHRKKVCMLNCSVLDCKLQLLINRHTPSITINSIYGISIRNHTM